jgi:hypothetical protein
MNKMKKIIPSIECVFHFVEFGGVKTIVVAG